MEHSFLRKANKNRQVARRATLHEILLETVRHSGRVASLCLMMGAKAGNVDLLMLHICALLHDVGKQSLPESLIGAPRKLPIPEPEPFPWGLIMTGLAVLLLLGGALMALVCLRSSQGVAVYNLVEDDYLCIGRQRLDYKKPVIDLNEFGDSVQSRFFSFVLDRASTRRLFGRNVTVTLGDITMAHRVKEMEGKYRFNLEMGVEL